MRIQIYMNFLGILLSIIAIIVVISEDDPSAKEMKYRDLFSNSNANMTVRSVQKIGER